MLDVPSLATLQTELGLACQAEASRHKVTDENFLALSQRLSGVYPERLARLALEQVLLRQRAADKFPQPSRMYFTRQGLEQATAWAVACHRANRFRGRRLIFDLCCGLGGDALALAEVSPVIGIDIDPLCAALVRANAAGLGLGERILTVVGDGLQPPLAFGPADSAFFDPSRRAEHRRIRRPEDYSPPLATLLRWVDRLAGLAVKVSPAIEPQALAGFACEVEFVSLEGDLKEATLWFGEFRSCPVRATVLPGGHTLAEAPQPPRGLSPPLAYLYEPDPAILRAGLVANLGQRLEATQLDPTIAFLTSARQTATPFARTYEVIDYLPFGRKRLQAALNSLQAGEVVFKKRGSPVDTEALARQLKLRGDRRLTVILTRLAGSPAALIVAPTPAANGRTD